MQPLKLSCHNKLLIQWNKAVVPMWKQLVLLRTQVEMVLFLLGKMILFNISVRSMHKVCTFFFVLHSVPDQFLSRI